MFALLADLGEDGEELEVEAGEGGEESGFVPAASRKGKRQQQQQQQAEGRQQQRQQQQQQAEGRQQQAQQQERGRQNQQQPAQNQRSQAPPQASTSTTSTSNGRGDGKERGEHYYRAFQRVFVSERGEVAQRFHKTDIVKVRPSGEVVLNSGGYLTLTTLMSMNDALHHINIRVKHTGGDIRDASNWMVHAGGKTFAYSDGLVIPAVTAADKGRASAVVQGMKELGVAVQGASAPAPAAARAPARPVAATGAGARAGAAALPTAGPLPRQQASPVPAPLNYAARLAASVQRDMEEDGGWGAPPAPISHQPQPHVPAEFAAPSAALTADAFLPFLPAQQQQQQQAAAAAEAGGGGQPGAAPAQGQGVNGGVGHEDEDELLCVICLEAERDTILLPCMHACLCKACADAVLAKQGSKGSSCPLCCTEVEEVLHIAA